MGDYFLNFKQNTVMSYCPTDLLCLVWPYYWNLARYFFCADFFVILFWTVYVLCRMCKCCHFNSNKNKSFYAFTHIGPAAIFLCTTPAASTFLEIVLIPYFFLKFCSDEKCNHDLAGHYHLEDSRACKRLCYHDSHLTVIHSHCFLYCSSCPSLTSAVSVSDIKRGNVCFILMLPKNCSIVSASLASLSKDFSSVSDSLHCWKTAAASVTH